MNKNESTSPEDEEFVTGTHDRRRAQRKALESEVKVSFETKELSGVGNNLSQTGILFFTEGDLRVNVQVEQDGETKTMTGSLVRCERIKGDHRGWAVEFNEG
ncbi:MAG: hypothetical protein ACI8X5_001420 [Planctomycetota bacterium]|jgi:hypothetical protein